MEVLNLRNNPILTSSSEINEICAPLFRNSPIKFFRYVKVFSNGEYITLCNDSRWVEHYLLHDYYKLAYYENNSLAWEKAPSIFLWLPFDNELLSDAKNYYDIDHGVTLLEKNKSYCELFHFASNRQGGSAINFYLNYEDTLKRFIAYFKFKAAKLISTVEKQKIIIPGFNENDKDSLINSSHNKEDFLNATSMDYSVLNIETKQIVNLNKIEMKCCYYSIAGKNVKEIANTLGLSHKSINKYLDNIRLKLGIYSKHQLDKVIPAHLLDHISAEID